MENHSVVEVMIREVAETSEEEVESFSEMEQRLREQLKAIGQGTIGLWLQGQPEAEMKEARPCPHCGEQAQYERQREGKLRTVFGEIAYRRSYYKCEQCHQGHYPLDERLGLRPNAMSAEVERLAGMMGVQMPFGKGSQIFEELTLIPLSDHSLDKASQAYGQAAEEQEAEWREETQDAAAMPFALTVLHRRLRFYGAIDGGVSRPVPPREQNNPGAN